MQLGRYEEAFALSTALMRQNPNQANLLFWRAKCLYYMVRRSPPHAGMRPLPRDQHYSSHNSITTQLVSWCLSDGLSCSRRET